MDPRYVDPASTEEFMTAPSTPPEVSILVVAYNSASIIADCLEAIPKACTRHNYEVLLVDNGDGGSAALVAKDFPQVRIVASRGNIGFAAGNNLLAQSAQAPLLLLVNPDLQMRAGAVDELLSGVGRHPEAAAWGGVTLDREGRPDIGNSVHVPSLKEMASRLLGRSLSRIEEGDDFERDEQVHALSGGFVMISRRAWDAADGLDERYFLYCEEVDLFARLALMGFVFWRIGKARAFHDAGHGNDFSPMRLLYRAAGTMQFARLHWSYPRQLSAFALIWLGAAQRYAAGKLLGHWRPRLRKVANGHRGLVFRPGHWRCGYHPTKGLLSKLKQMPL
jgi:N-acetylglucosaminyl-diphospho-decaprenol L-rhamnosyltransferase